MGRCVIFEVHIIELRKKLNGSTKVDDWIRLFNAKTEDELDMIQTKKSQIVESNPRGEDYKPE